MYDACFPRRRRERSQRHRQRHFFLIKEDLTTPQLTLRRLEFTTETLGLDILPDTRGEAATKFDDHERNDDKRQRYTELITRKEDDTNNSQRSDVYSADCITRGTSSSIKEAHL